MGVKRFRRFRRFFKKILFFRFIDAQTWNEPLYPPCCFGSAYFLASRAVSDLIAAHEAGNEPFVPFEDVYITGDIDINFNILRLYLTEVDGATAL